MDKCQRKSVRCADGTFWPKKSGRVFSVAATWKMIVKVKRMERLTSGSGGSWPSVCPDGGDGILRLSVRVGRAGVDIFQRNGASNGRRSSPKCEESEVQVFMCLR